MIQETFQAIATPKDMIVAWAKFLHDGFLADSAAKPEPLKFNGGASTKFVGGFTAVPAAAENTYEVVFTACSKMDDGRYNNNGWLQEIPDPITKITWDNAALVSPETAKKLAIQDNDLIEISTEKGKASGSGDRGARPCRWIDLRGAGLRTHGDWPRREEKRGSMFIRLRTTAQPYFVTGAQVRATGEQISACSHAGALGASKAGQGT